MQKIKLELSEWEYDPGEQLGPDGGFGVVFAGRGAQYGPVAVKRLNIGAREAAHRELKIAKELAGREFTNVLPVYDSGQDANSDSYFVVMALAQKSLQDELDAGTRLDDLQAAIIMTDIAKGIAEVSDMVHRDLKPGNVLYHDGKWKVADFGIARFVEDSTSLQTVRACLTPQYAAPEQWRLERPTTAVDIYALGCIGYSLLTGRPPFQGPSQGELKQQHLFEAPPSLEGHCAQLTSLLSMMLRKAQETRPRIDRVLDILQPISGGASMAKGESQSDPLATAGLEAARREAEEQARRERVREELERRKCISSEAQRILGAVKERLFNEICERAPAAERSRDVITLAQARLFVSRMYHDDRLVRCEAFPHSKWDVVEAALICVQQREPEYEWSASLWYSKLPSDENYRWREVAYFANPLMLQDRVPVRFEPFALRNLSDADRAASPGMDSYEIAEGPKPIDDEHFADFCDRWSGRLAKAVTGKLGRPRTLPVQ
jgi:serine/threonine protein kinase